MQGTAFAQGSDLISPLRGNQTWFAKLLGRCRHSSIQRRLPVHSGPHKHPCNLSTKPGGRPESAQNGEGSIDRLAAPRAQSIRGTIGSEALVYRPTGDSRLSIRGRIAWNTPGRYEGLV